MYGHHLSFYLFLFVFLCVTQFVGRTKRAFSHAIRALSSKQVTHRAPLRGHQCVTSEEASREENDSSSCFCTGAGPTTTTTPTTHWLFFSFVPPPSGHRRLFSCFLLLLLLLGSPLYNSISIFQLEFEITSREKGDYYHTTGDSVYHQRICCRAV